MIWLLLYTVIAFVVWVVAARKVATVDGVVIDSEDRIFALLVGGGLGLIWPVTLVSYGVYLAAFGGKRT